MVYYIKTIILAKRGWVFQERVLPPRVLYFGSRQISWECREGSACETFPMVVDIGHIAEYWRAIPRLTPGGPFVYEHTGSIARNWINTFFIYSRGMLTVSSDKPVAISGISRRFAETFGTTYLAGFWKEDLLTQLVWASVSRKPKPDYVLHHGPGPRSTRQSPTLTHHNP